MKKVLVLFAVVLGLSLGVSQVVRANTIKLVNFDSYAGFTGEIRYQFLPGGDIMGAFCVQRNIAVSVPGEYNYTLSALTDDLIQAAYLIEKYGPTAHGAFTGYSGYPNYTLLETSVALQLAVWKLDNNSDDDNGFPTIGRIHDLYTTFLYLAGSNEPTGNWAYADLRTLSGQDVQDQLVNHAVPEPTTILLLGLGLIGLAGSRKKYKK